MNTTHDHLTNLTRLPKGVKGKPFDPDTVTIGELGSPTFDVRWEDDTHRYHVWLRDEDYTWERGHTANMARDIYLHQIDNVIHKNPLDCELGYTVRRHRELSLEVESNLATLRDVLEVATTRDLLHNAIEEHLSHAYTEEAEDLYLERLYHKREVAEEMYEALQEIADGCEDKRGTAKRALKAATLDA